MGIFMQWRELGSHLTLRWRGVDSKFQFRATVGGLARRRNARSEQSTAFCREIEFAMVAAGYHFRSRCRTGSLESSSLATFPINRNGVFVKL